jgi:hypothetical protein
MANDVSRRRARELTCNHLSAFFVSTAKDVLTRRAAYAKTEDGEMAAPLSAALFTPIVQLRRPLCRSMLGDSHTSPKCDHATHK